MPEFTKSEVTMITNKLAEFYDELKPYLPEIINEMNRNGCLYCNSFINASCAHEIIDKAFSWVYSEKGYKYWFNIHDYLFELESRFKK